MNRKHLVIMVLVIFVAGMISIHAISASDVGTCKNIKIKKNKNKVSISGKFPKWKYKNVSVTVCKPYLNGQNYYTSKIVKTDSDGKFKCKFNTKKWDKNISYKVFSNGKVAKNNKWRFEIRNGFGVYNKFTTLSDCRYVQIT